MDMLEDACSHESRPTEADAALACTHTSVRTASRRLGQLYDDALAPVGLTSSQGRLLCRLADAGPAGAAEGGHALQALAGVLSIQMSAVTHALRPLVRDGLVEVRTDAVDRRVKRAVLTPLGRRRAEEVIGIWTDANDRVETALGAEAAGVLRRLCDAVLTDAFLAAFHGASAPAGKSVAHAS